MYSFERQISMVSGDIYNRLVKKIETDLKPISYKVIDDSHKHAGHAGHDGLGESHFRIKIVSSVFEGLSRVDRQRRIYDLFKEEIEERIHAISLRLMTPEEEMEK